MYQLEDLYISKVDINTTTKCNIHISIDDLFCQYILISAVRYFDFLQSFRLASENCERQ